jgi:hypothetical protein
MAIELNEAADKSMQNSLKAGASPVGVRITKAISDAAILAMMDELDRGADLPDVLSYCECAIANAMGTIIGSACGLSGIDPDLAQAKFMYNVVANFVEVDLRPNEDSTFIQVSLPDPMARA